MINDVGMWADPLDVFDKFEFQIDRSPNFRAVGGQKSPLPIDKTHHLYNSLPLQHKLCLQSQ